MAKTTKTDIIRIIQLFQDCTRVYKQHYHTKIEEKYLNKSLISYKVKQRIWTTKTEKVILRKQWAYEMSGAYILKHTSNLCKVKEKPKHFSFIIPLFLLELDDKISCRNDEFFVLQHHNVYISSWKQWSHWLNHQNNT